MKPRVYPLRADQPEAAFGLSERVDFYVSELNAPLAQGPEGFARTQLYLRLQKYGLEKAADE